MAHNEERIAVLETRVTQHDEDIRDLNKRLRAVEMTVWKGVGVVSFMIWLSKFIKLP